MPPEEAARIDFPPDHVLGAKIGNSIHADGFKLGLFRPAVESRLEHAPGHDASDNCRTGPVRTPEAAHT